MEADTGGQLPQEILQFYTSSVMCVQLFVSTAVRMHATVNVEGTTGKWHRDVWVANNSLLVIEYKSFSMLLMLLSMSTPSAGA